MPLTRRSSTAVNSWQNRQERLGAERAVRADNLDILAFQLRRGISGAYIAVGRASSE